MNELISYCQKCNSGDVDGLVRMFSPDIVYVGVNRSLQGRDEVASMYAESFEHGESGRLEAGVISNSEVGLWRGSELIYKKQFIFQSGLITWHNLIEIGS